MQRFSSLRFVRRTALAILTLLLASAVTLAYVPPGGSGDTTTDRYDGICGSSNGATLDRKPKNLCSKGRDSSMYVNGGKWTWLCYGNDGGQDASCSATIATSGACGDSDSWEYLSAPTTGLCTNSMASDITASSNSGPWSWTCTGSDTGTPASCSTLANGTCGSSSGVAFTATPTTGLCTSGLTSAITAVSTSGPWTWSCSGAGGGTTASCGTLSNGSCGASNGKTLTAAPTADLCTTGTASALTGSGPWSWSCTGSGGGTTASCSASMSTDNQPIAPQVTVADQKKAVIKDVPFLPAGNAQGASGAIYVAAIFSGNVFFLGSNGAWSPYAAGNATAYFTGKLAATTLDIIPTEMDLSTLPGAQILVGYGRGIAPLSNPFDDMVRNATYNVIYTVQ